MTPDHWLLVALGLVWVVVYLVTCVVESGTITRLRKWFKYKYGDWWF